MLCVPCLVVGTGGFSRGPPGGDAGCIITVDILAVTIVTTFVTCNVGPTAVGVGRSGLVFAKVCNASEALRRVAKVYLVSSLPSVKLHLGKLSVNNVDGK